MKHYPEYKQRYYDLHFSYYCKRAPSIVRDGLLHRPTIPKVATANGLTQYIEKFINWAGYRATRINTMGRVVKGRWIHSSTRKGTADISSTIKGRTIMWEIKVGRDRPRPEQLEEQRKEIMAGGLYFFVSTPEEFIEIFDALLR